MTSTVGLPRSTETGTEGVHVKKYSTRLRDFLTAFTSGFCASKSSMEIGIRSGAFNLRRTSNVKSSKHSAHSLKLPTWRRSEACKARPRTRKFRSKKVQ